MRRVIEVFKDYLYRNCSIMSHYLYLIHEREFIKTGESIYKLGKTTQERTSRFREYTKGSQLLLHIRCTDCHREEKELIELFTKKYKLRKDIGAEYFEGDCKSMINTVVEHVMKNSENQVSWRTYVNNIVFIGVVYMFISLM